MVCFTKGAQSLPHQGFSAIASAFRKTALLSLLAGVCLAVMLPFLLPMVFGDAFSKAVPLSMILITGTVISGLCQVLDQALRGQGRPYFGLAGRLVAAMALGIVGFLLSRSWSVIGIAIAFSVAQFIGLAILCCKCTRWYCDAKMNSLLPGSEDLRSMFSKMPEIRFKAP
jgi:O-antigen/teichoic acid export membrane protein